MESNGSEDLDLKGKSGDDINQQHIEKDQEEDKDDEDDDDNDDNDHGGLTELIQDKLREIINCPLVC